MSAGKPSQALIGRPLELALSAGQSQPDRLPGLMAVLKQLPEEINAELKSAVHQLPRIKLIDVTAATFVEYGGIDEAGLGAVYWAERWHHRLYCIAEPAAVWNFLEVAFGGEGNSARGDPIRSCSKTELSLAGILFKRIARAMTNAFSLCVDVKFETTVVSKKWDDETACRPSTPIIVARLEMTWRGVPGILHLIIPQAALETIRDVLSSNPEADVIAPSKVEEDDWTLQLREEIARAFVTLNAVLEERTVELSEVRRFEIGSTLELACDTLSVIRLDVEERPAYWCELGKIGQGLSLRIDREFDPCDISADAIL